MKHVILVFACVIFTVQAQALEEARSMLLEAIDGAAPMTAGVDGGADANYAKMLMHFIRLNQDRFALSANDITAMDDGPMVSLEPAVSCLYLSKSGRNISVDLYNFTKDYSAVQITIHGEGKTIYCWKGRSSSSNETRP